MQNRYAWDIGDYSKFVLIKRLFGDKKTGLVWYLYPDESHNKDGLHTDYQKYETQNKITDKELIEILKKVADSEKRDICSLQNSLKEYLNDSVVYFGGLIEDNYYYRERKNKRDEWVKKAISEIKDCEVVFLDPDNGIEVKSVKKTHKKGGKYVFFDEIEKFFEVSDILIVYQHFPRVKQEKFIKDMFKKIKSKIKGKYGLYALKFKPVSPRVYFIMVKENKKEEFERRLSEFFESEYYRGFENIKE